MTILMGYLLGLSFGILMGPVAFTLIKSTLHQGRRAGLVNALGIATSDVAIISICVAGYSRYFVDRGSRLYIGLAGAAILFLLSARFILRPSQVHLEEDVGYRGLLRHFAHGLLTNGVNPFVFGIWLVVISEVDEVYGRSHLVPYLVAAVLGIVTTDVAKVLLAHRIRRWLDPKTLGLVFRCVGVVLAGFGGYVLHAVLIAA